jgi:hypothetical protein
MGGDSGIDAQRYRSAALGYAYAKARGRGIAMKALPPVMLEEIGIVKKEGICTTFEVCVPDGMGCRKAVERMGMMEREMARALGKPRAGTHRRAKKAIMPESWPGKGDFGRSANWEDEANAPAPEEGQ